MEYNSESNCECLIPKSDERQAQGQFEIMKIQLLYTYSTNKNY